MLVTQAAQTLLETVYSFEMPKGIADRLKASWDWENVFVNMTPHTLIRCGPFTVILTVLMLSDTYTNIYSDPVTSWPPRRPSGQTQTFSSQL